MDATLLLIALAAAVVVAVVFGINAVRGARAESADKLARLAEIAEGLAITQAEFSGKFDEARKTTGERLDALSKRLGDGLTESTEKTGKTLKELHERLAVFAASQKSVTDLSQQLVGQMAGLQDILSNKQARGAFGEVRLQDMVQDCLPAASFELQEKLSNGKIVDCLLKLPNPPGSIAVDAKFPLEAYLALQEAMDAGAKKRAATAFRTDVLNHVKSIGEKYVIPGETAEWALLFLPSEAIYSELQVNFRTIVDEAHRRRVAIVSPNTMWGVLNTIRALLRDVRLREQAHLIQAEVHKMLGDVDRLNKRVNNLQRHFDHAVEDIREIGISSDNIVRLGERIEDMQLEDSTESEELLPSGDQLREV